MASDQEIFQFDPNRLTSIRCTLADLQLVQTVLIDVTVSVSRDYGILTTGICDSVSLDAVEQFENSIHELKNIAMQLKQNTGWVTVKETARKRKVPIPKSHSHRKKKSRRGRSSGSSSEESDSNPVSESTAVDTRNFIGEQEDNISNAEGIECDINQSVTNQTSDSFMMTCESQPDRLPLQSDDYEVKLEPFEVKLEPFEVLDTDDIKGEETALFTTAIQQQYSTASFIGSQSTSTQPSSDEQLYQQSMPSTSSQSYTINQPTIQFYSSDVLSHSQNESSAHPVESMNAPQPSTSQVGPLITGDRRSMPTTNIISNDSTVFNVCEWLSAKGVSEGVIATLRENEVDGMALLHLNEKDIQLMMPGKVGPARKILSLVEKLQSAPTPTNSIQSPYTIYRPSSSPLPSCSSGKSSNGSRRSPSLPQFSDKIKTLLEAGEIWKDWCGFIEENAYYILAHMPSMTTRGEYAAYGQAIVARYPCVKHPGRHPWTFFTSKLSQKIRNMKWRRNKRAQIKPPSKFAKRRAIDFVSTETTHDTEDTEFDAEELLSLAYVV